MSCARCRIHTKVQRSWSEKRASCGVVVYYIEYAFAWLDLSNISSNLMSRKPRLNTVEDTCALRSLVDGRHRQHISDVSKQAALRGSSRAEEFHSGRRTFRQPAEFSFEIHWQHGEDQQTAETSFEAD